MTKKSSRSASAHDHRERLDDLVRALETLPPNLREIYLLSARDGLSNGMIGERLGLTDTVVEDALAAALAGLDRALDAR